MINRRFLPLLILALLSALAVGIAAACGGGGGGGTGADSKDFDGAEVTFDLDERAFFVEPEDGAEVTSPVKVVMGTEGLIVRRRFEPQKRYGHHHILINQPNIPDYGERIPVDDKHLHFHAIEKETFLDLPPGEHTLTLLFGNAHDHPYEFHGRESQEHALAVKRSSAGAAQDRPPLTHTIKITVTEARSLLFEEPTDNSDIREFPFTIKLKAEGFEGAAGHFVIQYGPYIVPKPGTAVPEDENHIHLEPGQTETQMDVGPGGWPFTVFYVDENSMVSDPPVSDKINITAWKKAETKSENESVPAFRITAREDDESDDGDDGG
jgi:hypothetical protein